MAALTPRRAHKREVLALQVAGDGAQHRRHLAGLRAVGVPAPAQPLADVVEQLDQVLDDRDQLVGLLAAALRVRGGHRGQRVEDADLQRLVAPAAGDDAELDALTGLELRRPRGEGVLVHEDVRAVLAREEAETLLRLDPLDLAGGHVGSLSRSIAGPAPGRGTTAARCRSSDRLTGAAATRRRHSVRP